VTRFSSRNEFIDWKYDKEYSQRDKSDKGHIF
jgi:hypothetical protein